MATFKELDDDPAHGFWMSRVWWRDFGGQKGKGSAGIADPTDDQYQPRLSKLFCRSGFETLPLTLRVRSRPQMSSVSTANSRPIGPPAVWSIQTCVGHSASILTVCCCRQLQVLTLMIISLFALSRRFAFYRRFSRASWRRTTRLPSVGFAHSACGLASRRLRKRRSVMTYVPAGEVAR